MRPLSHLPVACTPLVRLGLVGFLLATACSSNEEGVIQSPRDGRVRFVAIGDFGTGHPPQQEVADAMCAHHDQNPFDFVVSTGDNVYPDGHPDDFDEKFFEPYECLTERGVRWHSVLGNHDVSTDEGRPQIDEPAFGMPSSFYTWRLGDVAFVMLDSNELDSPGDEQIAWMEDRLREAREAPWTVVVFHEPVYSAGQHGSTPRFDTLLADRFETVGVDLVINGHDHLYVRASNDNVDYLVTGGGGAAIDQCDSPLPAEVAKCVPELHFLEVEATSSALVATAFSSDGRIIDRVDVRQRS